MADHGATLTLKVDTEEEILAKIERVSDIVTRRALLSVFFWRMAMQGIVNKSTVST